MGWLVMQTPQGEVFLGDDVSYEKYKRANGVTPYMGPDGRIVSEAEQQRRDKVGE